MRIAKAIFGLIGSALLGLLVTFAAIPEWTLTNLERNFWQTVGGFLISAAFGGAVVFIAYSTYVSWRLGSRPYKAFDDLRRIDGLGECESLADMVKPIKSLVSSKGELNARDERIAELERRPTQEELDERDVTISSLERDLGARDRADAERTRLRETFLHKIDFDQQAAVVDAWLSPGRRLDVSARPVRRLGGGFSLDELLVPDGDGWARATDGAVSLLDSSGDLVALVMGRELEAGGRAPRDDFARTLREMDFYTKSTLVAVWEHGSADVTWIDPDDPDVYDDMFSEMDETFLRMTNARLRDLELFGLVRYETVSGWDRRWTLEDGVADLLATHGDALDAAREDAGLTWERLTEIPGQGCPPSGEPSGTENGTVL